MVPAALKNQTVETFITVRTGWRVSKVVFHIATGFFLLLATGAIVWHHTPVQRAATRWWHTRLLRILNIELRFNQEAEVCLPALFVSNHISWIDIPVIGSKLPAYFLSKEEVRRWPLIGALAAGAGTLFIKRGNGKTHAAAQSMAAHIRQGRSILFFPEGTTTNGQSIRTYHHKLFACVAEETPVHVIALRYLDQSGQPCEIAPFIGDDEFVAHLLRLLRQDKIAVELVLSAPQYRTQQDDRRFAQALQQLTHRLQGSPTLYTDAVPSLS
ncbi:MAG TPA: 1-acyl-sn-glycerol-3-phosphate acyltransferase [Pseudomonadales bacterium]|nr:1-acyl-sn-glycerol-3-phosphate acyltransferase [Pseudomonadales bacterium]